ncbi:integrase, catalytic region, zinc finger, CCHC-type containing protein [Tanacetum coccineum]
METIHVKFDEPTAMTSEYDSLEPALQRFINDDSSVKSMNTPSKEDLNNLFKPMYEEYFEKRYYEMSINFATQQVHNHEYSPSTSSIIVKEQEVPPIVTTYDEQTSPISINKADEFNQEDSADFDGNTLLTPYDAPNIDEAESSTTALDPSNMHDGLLKEEVYVSQPDGFVNLDFPDHVYSLKKALFGLKQTPRACQSQYAIKLLKKHGMDDCVSMSTPIATERLDTDLQGTPTDQMTYHRMIGGLMYLTASRPDIAFAIFVCALYQACPMIKHLKVTQTMQDVKTIAKALQEAYNF